MTTFLNYAFEDTPESISAFDELPLWSSPFGLLLFKHLELKKGITLVDVGSGTGFPLLELAGRLGNTCTCIGVDNWTNANKRAREKIKNYGYTNVEIIDGSAESIPLNDQIADMVVSNLGLNNFENAGKSVNECHRILKTGGKIALTTNLNGHWKEFYAIFKETMLEMGMEKLLPDFLNHTAHRGTISSVSELLESNGLKIIRHFEDCIEMTFADGSAFLNHHFVKLGWLSGWKSLIPIEELEPFFSLLERNLNQLAGKSGKLTLTVPMAYIEAEKQ